MTTTKLDPETEAEIARAQERGRQERLNATAETAPAIVRRSIEMMLAAMQTRPDGRLLQLETLAVTAERLPKVTAELGRKHPLTIEWRRTHDDAVAWLSKDAMDRFIDANQRGTLRNW